MKILNKYKDIITNDSIYIGRGSKWGTPFIIGKDGSRLEVIEKYLAWILDNPKLLNDLHELKEHDMVCFCDPLLCHRDVLLLLIESMFEKE